MKKNKLFVLFLVFSFSLLGGVGLVHSTSTSQISASVNWTTFSITLNGTTDPVYNDQRSDSRANAGYTDSMGVEVDSGYQSPWSTPTSAENSILNAIGSAQTNSILLQANAVATADGINNTYARATSNVYRIGYFNVAANSTLDVSVLFDISYIFTYDPTLESVKAWNGYGLNLYRVHSSGEENPGYSEKIASSSYEFSLSGYSGVPDLNGKVWRPDYLLSSISISLVGGYDYGVDVFINTSANAGAPSQPTSVPEPVTMLLLASGLLGLVGLRRKFRK